MTTASETSKQQGNHAGAAPARRRVVIVGAGPAGLAAAEVLAEAGWAVTIRERMPNPARKFLLAGRGGLNLTHSEPLEDFLQRYGAARAHLEPAIRAFPPETLRAWCEALGQPTFVGSSGRVFPKAMKASPLLRAWLRRLGDLGVELKAASLWTGWRDNALSFATPRGEEIKTPDATIFALGGASWPRLGSDGGWTAPFAARGVAITALKPANSGFLVQWSDIFRTRFAGQPLKPALFRFNSTEARGEAMITEAGIEGGAIYALSAGLREAILTSGEATLTIDLHPGLAAEELAKRLGAAGKMSMANRLRRAGLSPLAASLLREHRTSLPADATELAALIKEHTIRLTGMAPIARAISTAGGIAWDAIAPDYSLHADPAAFVCGEMLDWEAPTGGYLLQACFATGRAAANGVIARFRTIPAR